MSITETARAKARAAVSAAQAEVTSLEAQLAQARRNLDSSEAAGALLQSVRETPLVGPLTAGVRDQTSVDKANATADIDRINAELSSARAKLERAEKAESLVLAATGGKAPVEDAPDQGARDQEGQPVTTEADQPLDVDRRDK